MALLLGLQWGLLLITSSGCRTAACSPAFTSSMLRLGPSLNINHFVSKSLNVPVMLAARQMLH